ncbi:CDP-alcohol phosphatidyltransferase family protein [Acidobacteriota bacterium]
MVDTVVILMKHEGKSPTLDIPWVFTPVVGLPLIERHLISVKSVGVRTAHLICGESEQKSLEGCLPRWNHDDRFPLVNIHGPGKNIISMFPERFLLMDGRNVYHPKLLKDTLSRNGVFVYIDADKQPLSLGMSTPGYLQDNFPANPDNKIAAPTGMYTQDVLKPEKHKAAERLILKTLIKDTDGWFSIHLNRPISLAISSILVNHSIHPHLITVITLFIGILSGVLTAMGTYGFMAAGGIVFQLASIMDGIDGEIARAKFLTSRAGEWMDTICDELTNVAFILGLTIGVYKMSASKIMLWLGIVTLFFYFLTIILLYGRLAFGSQSSSLLFFQEQIKTSEFQKKKTAPLITFLQPFVKRDLYAFIFMILAILGLPQIILLCWLVAMVITPILFTSHLIKSN